MTGTSIELAGRSVLVTGAAGFLGSHLTHRLLREGAEVHALVRREGSRRLADVRGRIVEHEGDVTDSGSVVDCTKRARPEVVVHLAADTACRRFSSGDWAGVYRGIDVNLVGTVNVLRAALDCSSLKTFLRAGGLEEYGLGAAPYDESQRERPASPYSASQVAATHYCQVLQQHTDTTIATLRPTLLYGPDQASDFFIPAVILACLRKEHFPMSSGLQQRDLLYVDDAVEAFVRAASLDGLHGAIVNLGHGVAHSISAVASEICTMAGRPGCVEVGALPDRSPDPVHLVTTTDTARQTLAWKPEIGLREGLERTVAWYRLHSEEMPSTTQAGSSGESGPCPHHLRAPTS